MRHLFLLIFFVQFSLFGAEKNLVKFVDPFIGTSGNGHTFPGPTRPFGLVQLSPDTDIKGWDYCSGYRYEDTSILGFSHTHLSGTGGADYGDILLLPFTGATHFNPGKKEDPDSGYRCRIDKESEQAQAGFYKVFLSDYQILAELTVTPRVGFHRYTFPQNESAKLLLDLIHGIADQPRQAYLRIVNDREVEGLRRSSGWAKDQWVFFVMRFSQPFNTVRFQADGKELTNKNEVTAQELQAVFDFGKLKQPLLIKVALSAVDENGARKNLEKELPHWNFDHVREQAAQAWNTILQKVEVEGGTTAQKTTFYTALYHAFIHPNIFSDVDGRYRGMDQKIHQSKDFNYYTLFSLWDTFRATHPLFNLLEPEKNNDFVKTLLAKYDEAGILPVWELASNETWTMIGYHSAPVIVDALLSGTSDADAQHAFQAVKHSAEMDHQGLNYYKTMGFIPMDREDDSVSRTLEYAYDDWCIAMLAKKLGREQEYQYYLRRARNYLNVFDRQTGFMRGRYFDGRWKANFNPEDSYGLGAGEYTEANAWQYLWFVPQDISGLIRLMGEAKAFEKKLDAFFNTEVKNKEHLPADVSGLVGQYAQGNEPDHHAPYLYNFVGAPYKTQKIVRHIMDTFYTTGPEGLCGNEDCGQMSAWYIFSALGFYPVTPGSGQFIIGSPLFKTAKLHLPEGRTFVISAANNSPRNIYVKSARLNGKPLTKSYISFKDVLAGGQLQFEMSDQPNQDWASQKENWPKTEIDPNLKPLGSDYVFVPYCISDVRLFSSEFKLQLAHVNPQARIYYTLDGSQPTTDGKLYQKPIVLTKTTTLKMFAELNGKRSEIVEEKFIKSLFRKSTDSQFPAVQLRYDFHPRYKFAGANGLMDGVLGSTQFTDQRWQGIEENDLIATIDFGQPTNIKTVHLRFYENQGFWIFSPLWLELQTSTDGLHFQTIRKVQNEQFGPFRGMRIVPFKLDQINQKARYLRIIAKNVAHNPEWHHAAGGKSWLFVDEIIVE